MFAVWLHRAETISLEIIYCRNENILHMNGGKKIDLLCVYNINMHDDTIACISHADTVSYITLKWKLHAPCLWQGSNL